MDVLWKDPTSDPTENLTKLSQITGAYASATMDKEFEIRQLLNEKEDQIQVLRQQLQLAHAISEAQIQFEKLQQEFQQM